MSLTYKSYNPDVLNCLANLSSDEVFTPPNIANNMLDMLPKDLWNNPKATFLDPVSKSGVFLREITKRLLKGLEQEIPDLQKRLNHILTKQVFGIAITELTSLMSRRTLYCSKHANGAYSICTAFKDKEGNIKYKNIEHTWDNKGKCIYCGASVELYERGEELEYHAYQFIHLEHPEDIYRNMKFDVIIGNPPYHMSDGGGRESSAVSIYDKFVKQAIKLSPHYISMIIPARWYSGGRGLGDFRNQMLNDNRISILHDFPETSDCFPGLNIRGGICYFLWNKNYNSENCLIYNHKHGKVDKMLRPLKESGLSFFIRYNKARSIIKKVRQYNEETFGEVVSSRNPFGIASNFKDFKKMKSELYKIRLYSVNPTSFISINQVPKNEALVYNIKVLVSKASPGDDTYPHKIISEPILAEELSCCTETYLIVNICKNLKEAQNLIFYMKTKFFRFMMALLKPTQNISKKVFDLVPIQDLSIKWTDEMLYEKYGITDDEIDFIQTLIRPMEDTYE